MENRIKSELRGRNPNEVTNLDLDGCEATQIKGLTDEFVNLEILSLIHAGLTTLKGFPALPNLKRLDLSDNAITGTLDLLAGSPDLAYLNLSGNKIKDLKTVKPLEKFTQLTDLVLAGNDLAMKKGYREQMFKRMPSLQFLDGLDKDGNEMPVSMEEKIATKLGSRFQKHQVEVLTLDNCKATQIQGLTDEFVSLKILNMPDLGLTSLEGFPALPKLEELDLSRNAITGTLDLLAGSPGLWRLNLSRNKIKDLETIKPLAKLTQLTSLDLTGCEVSEYDDYREKIFELIPWLVFLNGYDRAGEEEFVGCAKNYTAFAVPMPSAAEGEERSTRSTNDQSKAVDVKKRERMALAAAANLTLDEYDKREEDKDQAECEKRMHAKQVLPVLAENEDEESEGEGEEGDEVPEDEDEISDEEDGAEGQNNHAGPSGKKPNEKKPRGKKHAEEDEDGEDD